MSLRTVGRKLARTVAARDAEWNRALGISGKILTPEEAAKWLEQDRIQRARNVSDARIRRGPERW